MADGGSFDSPDPDPVDAESGPLLYSELAEWWPLLSPPEDYAEEAAFYVSHLAPGPPASRKRSLLELGSGGGNNASFLKHAFDLTLVDLSTGMLAHSRRINPECEHLTGDMRSIRLGRLFDRVFIHDAICYMTSADDLRRAIDTAFVHCRPGGIALFAPDYLSETFEESTDDGGADQDGRGLRYLEWVHDPDPDDSVYTVDYAYLLREGDGSVRVAHDRHTEGLFSHEFWMTTIASVGFEPDVVLFRHSDVERELVVFAGRRPYDDGPDA